MAATGGSATSFYKASKAPIEPGEEHSRYGRLQTTATLTMISGVVFAAITAVVAFLWLAAFDVSKAFAVPCFLGFFAA